MAKRPIFLPKFDNDNLVFERYVEFQWSPGMAVSQKRKSISDLHRMAGEKLGVDRPLEVSSKSENEIGVALSSFNLKFTTAKGLTLSVECAFQGSKVFEHGGPFRDLFQARPMDAKRDRRLQESGRLVGFSFFHQDWPTSPLTAFYDWLYIQALMKNPELAELSTSFDGFTDIEFNPEKSINCQARSVALYQALLKTGQLDNALRSPESFRSLYAGKRVDVAQFHKLQERLI
jgi:hypothetical protein